ncbi:mCG146109, partial [Mus musculus]
VCRSKQSLSRLPHPAGSRWFATFRPRAPRSQRIAPCSHSLAPAVLPAPPSTLPRPCDGHKGSAEGPRSLKPLPGQKERIHRVPSFPTAQSTHLLISSFACCRGEKEGQGPPPSLSANLEVESHLRLLHGLDGGLHQL